MDDYTATAAYFESVFVQSLIARRRAAWFHAGKYVMIHKACTFYKGYTMELNSKILRYSGLYLIPYIGLSLALTIGSALIGWEPPSVLSFVIAMVSSYYPAYQFVKDLGRAPNKSEKHSFAGTTLLVTTALSGLFLAAIAVILPELREQVALMMEELGAGVFFLIIAATLLLFYGSIYFGFDQGVKMQIKVIEKSRTKDKP
jgi:hypothetical protein